MAELPFDAATLAPADRAIFERLKAKRAAAGAPFDGPYLALMNHPELTEKIEALGYFLKFDGALPRDVYQFVVLTVARHCRVPFEWVDHLQPARAAGVPEAVIAAMLAEDGSGFPEPYATARGVVVPALAWQDVPAAAQAAAIARFGVKGFVELVVLAGFYEMFSSINQGFGVALRPGDTAPF